MKVLAAAAVLSLSLPLPAAALDVEEEAGALFGIEFDDLAPGEEIAPGRLSCVELGAAALMVAGEAQPHWAAGSAVCQGRRVELLKRAIGGQEGGRVRWRVEDALLLPPLAPPDEIDPQALSLAGSGACRMAGGGETSFIALLRWGTRNRVGIRSEIAQAWRYDLDKGRILQMPVSRVRCERAALP